MLVFKNKPVFADYYNRSTTETRVSNSTPGESITSDGEDHWLRSRKEKIAFGEQLLEV